MTRRVRGLMILAILCGAAALVLPLWEVRLKAPQYPEGIGLRILAHTVTGLKPNDLANINGLNHYIGMKAIEPDAIPELRVMPWIIGALLLSGIGLAARGMRRSLIAWLGAFVLLGIVGLYDFYRWEYDYGHNLDMEQAIIVVPGMTYQPPLIGSKQLLNFTAIAWPGTGALALGVAFLGVAAGLVVTRRRTDDPA